MASTIKKWKLSAKETEKENSKCAKLLLKKITNSKKTIVLKKKLQKISIISKKLW